MAAIQSRFEVAVPELPDHIDPASYSTCLLPLRPRLDADDAVPSDLVIEWGCCVCYFCCFCPLDRVCLAYCDSCTLYAYYSPLSMTDICVRVFPDGIARYAMTTRGVTLV